MSLRPGRLDYTPALIVAGAATAVMLLLGLLVRRSAPDPVSTPLVDPDGRLYYLVAVASAAGIALTAALRGLAAQSGRRSGYWRSGVVPGFAALAGSLFLVWHHEAAAIILVPLAVGGTILLHLVLPRMVVGRREQEIARDLLTMVALYFVVTMIMSFRVDTVRGLTVLDGAAVGIASAVAIVARIEAEIDQRRVVRATVVGLVAAELVWAFSYLDMSHWFSAIPVAAIAAIGGWQVRRDESAGRQPIAAAHPAGEPEPSNVRPGP